MSIPKTVPRDNRFTTRGFTLIEVLAALSLVVFLAGGIYPLASGAIQLGVSLNKARVEEARIQHFTMQCRDFFGSLAENDRLGTERVSGGREGRVLLVSEGHAVPFAWSKAARFSDATEFVLAPEPAGGQSLVVRHLRKLQRASNASGYEMIGELPVLRGLKSCVVDFYDTQLEKWVPGWKETRLPWYCRVRLQFNDQAAAHEFVFWVSGSEGVFAPAPSAAPSSPDTRSIPLPPATTPITR